MDRFMQGFHSKHLIICLSFSPSTPMTVCFHVKSGVKCTHFDFVKSHGHKGGLGILGEVAGVTLVADSAHYIYIDC